MPLTLLTLFLTFLKAGCAAPGNGYASLSPIRKALVKQHQWMSEDDFAQSLIAVHAIPGIFNINLATYIGKQLLGWKGSMVAVAGMVLPPFVVLLIIVTFFDTMRQIPVIEKFLRGARPAIIALIILPCIQMWREWKLSLSTIWLPIGTAIAIGLLGISPTFILLGFIILGLLYAFAIKS